MDAHKFIVKKQVEWARNHSIVLINSRGNPDNGTYTTDLRENLLEPLSPEARESFGSGDGSEIEGDQGSPAKMQAVHSSSALGVNIFHYWQTIGQVPVIAAPSVYVEKVIRPHIK